MRPTRTTALVEYKLISRLEKIRRTLASDQFAGRVEKPLAFWALPNDRRLPLAFMGRSVKNLIETPFDELMGTPGVGQKKIASLVALLHRVAENDTDESAPAEHNGAPAGALLNGGAVPATFDADAISEATWTQWRRAVLRHNLGHETLGRIAPSLQRLSRVLWHTSLDTYTNQSLDEIRHLKTHGIKRVAAVLEVFGEIYAVVGKDAADCALAVRIVPRFVIPIEAWLREALAADDVPTASQLKRCFTDPLIEQIELDAGDQVAELARRRIAASSDGSNVRAAAREWGLTRARIYQLLADVGTIIEVRWPEGRALIARLCDKLTLDDRFARERDDFFAAADLFFPGCRDGQQAEETDLASDLDTHRRAG